MKKRKNKKILTAIELLYKTDFKLEETLQKLITRQNSLEDIMNELLRIHKHYEELEKKLFFNK